MLPQHMVFSTAVYRFIMLGDRGVCAGSPALLLVPSTLRPWAAPVPLFPVPDFQSSGIPGILDSSAACSLLAIKMSPWRPTPGPVPLVGPGLVTSQFFPMLFFLGD